MPHFGEIQSLVGTLRSDGLAYRGRNSLTAQTVSASSALLIESGFALQLEDATSILLES